MMGRLDQNQERLFYSFCLDEAVPDDHLVRQIAAVLDLSWVHAELMVMASPWLGLQPEQHCGRPLRRHPAAELQESEERGSVRRGRLPAVPLGSLECTRPTATRIAVWYGTGEAVHINVSRSHNKANLGISAPVGFSARSGTGDCRAGGAGRSSVGPHSK